MQEPLVAYLQSTWVVESEGDFVEDWERLASRHREFSPDPFAFSCWIAESHRFHGRRLSATRRFLAAGLRHKQPKAFWKAGTTLVDPGVANRIRRARLEPSPDWLSEYRPNQGL